jgi:putative membrane protein
MGIGQMFLCIGMWVGAFGMIMVLDRHRRVKKISTRKWYFSKSLVMGTISVIQSSLLMLSICGLGFYKLGTYFPLEWLMILFAGLIFIIIIQAIWYSFRDKSIASFIIVVFLILNICCGGGTFPAFMLNPLFMVLSYIMPFTYLIHAQGAIIYGLSAGVNIFSNWMMVLQSCGILLIFPIVFFLWGLFISRRREREIFYGSCNKKDVLHSLQLLHMDKKYLNIKGELDWKKLPKEIMPKVVELTLSNHPYEKKFKWFEKYRKEIEKDSLNVED